MSDRSEYFSPDMPWPNDQLLENWRWLIGPSRFRVHRVTALGSLFLVKEDGTVFFLNTTRATIERACEDLGLLDELFESKGARQHYLWSFLIRELRRRGTLLNVGQCYGWKIPLVLGGEPDIENLEPSELIVFISMQGQIHSQAKNFKDGTVIEEIIAEGPPVS